MKLGKEITHNLQCLICQRVYGSAGGLTNHLQRKHGKAGAQIGVNWRWTKKAVSPRRKGGAKRQ